MKKVQRRNFMITKHIQSTIIHTAVISGIFVSTLTLGVPGVFAQTVTSPSATRAAMKEARQGQNMDRLKIRAGQEIDRRTASLNKLITTINNIKRLTSDQKSSLVGQIQVEITNLATLKAKIQGDTDLATVKTDVQSVIKSFRVYALFMPKVQIMAHADQIFAIVDDMNKATPKLQTRIDNAKNAGKDVSQAVTAMSDRAAKLADAKTKAQNAIDIVTPLKPEDYPGNKGALQSARDMLKTARGDLKAAYTDAQQVRQQTKGMSKSLGASGTTGNSTINK